jgi:choline dehydrogenase-like flavoprotein
VFAFIRSASESFDDFIQVGIYPLRPKSRGTVILQSADPYEYPIIDPNYLEKIEDVREMRSTVHIARQVFETYLTHRPSGI